MRLYLLRHASALERGAPGYTNDRSRFLTEAGREEAEKTAAAIKRLGLNIKTVLSSPYIRAKETAEIFCKVLRIEGGLKFEPTLSSGLDPVKFLQEVLPDYIHESGVLVVGHEPFLSELISLLISKERGALIDFKKAGFCCVEVEEDGKRKIRGMLKWLFTPKTLKALTS